MLYTKVAQTSACKEIFNQMLYQLELLQCLQTNQKTENTIIFGTVRGSWLFLRKKARRIKVINFFFISSIKFMT